MKMCIQKLSLVDVLRGAVEAWRRDSGHMSRETVAIYVTEAHERIGADAATGITFDSTSKDAYTKAKGAAQKLYRWLGGDDEHEAKLPANMVPTLLAALPMDRRVSVLNQILCPLGLEVRPVDQAPATGFDAIKHLRSITKEGSEAKMALLTVSPDATDADLLEAHRELAEAETAYGNAKADLMAKITARQALARASAQST
jgi:enolase